MSVKLTFKKHPKATGLYAVGNSLQSVDIKWGGSVIGTINAPNWTTKDGLYGICVAVKSSDHWRWLFCNKRCETEQDARELSYKYVEYLIDKGYEIHKFED